jgi:hypothetical protein
MTVALASELARMSRRQKLNLADKLLTDAGAHNQPARILSANDPALVAELKRRLADRRPGAWLSLDEFRAQSKGR